MGVENSQTAALQTDSELIISSSISFGNIKLNLTKVLPYAFTNTSIKKLTFPASLLEIGEYSFANCTSLAIVDLSSSKLTNLPKYTFYNCISLANLKLPNSIVDIADYALYGTKIITISVDKHLQSVGKYVFANNPILKSLDFSSSSIKSIPEGLVYGCSSIKFVSLPPQLEKIESYSFAQSGILSMEFPETVIHISEYAFAQCSAINEFNLSKLKITEIFTHTFYKCNGVLAVTLPLTIEKIHSYAFYENSFLSINFPPSLSEIGEFAFHMCARLESIDLSNTRVDTLHQECFKGCSNLIRISLPATFSKLENSVFASTGIKNFTFLASVKTIGEGIFHNCQQLTSVDMSPLDTKIIPKHIFRKCKNLKEIKFSQKLQYIDEFAFALCQSLTEINLLDTELFKICNSAFLQCTGLKNVKICKSLTELEASAFVGCEQLTDININESSLTTIGNHCFSKCSNLNLINFPQTLREICEETFELASLEKVTLPASIQQIHTGAFMSCPKLVLCDMSACVSLFYISADTFKGDALLSVVVLPPKLKSIGIAAFMDTSISEIIFPNSIELIEKQSFSSSKLASLNLNETNIAKIEQEAFANCPYLNTINFGSKLKSIAVGAFSKCTKLSTVNFANVTVLSENMFDSCSNLETVILPETLLEIRSKAFQGTAIEKLRIPPSVFKISLDAFTGMAKLDALSYCGTSEFATLFDINNQVKVYVKNNYPYKSFGGLGIVGFDDCPVFHIERKERKFRNVSVILTLLLGILGIGLLFFLMMKLFSYQPKNPADEDALLHNDKELYKL